MRYIKTFESAFENTSGIEEGKYYMIVMEEDYEVVFGQAMTVDDSRFTKDKLPVLRGAATGIDQNTGDFFFTYGDMTYGGECYIVEMEKKECEDMIDMTKKWIGRRDLLQKEIDEGTDNTFNTILGRFVKEVPMSVYGKGFVSSYATKDMKKSVKELGDDFGFFHTKKG